MDRPGEDPSGNERTRVPAREGLSEEKARQSDRLLGQKLGDYRVLREIGRGGMGIVFEGVQEGLSRRVAIKVLPTSLLSSPGLVDRFLREARASARLQHPNIVKVHSVGQEGEVHYFGMEYIVGSSLEDILEREKRISSYYGMDVFRQVASALAYSHAQGVIHRDIKPANIMVDPSGKVTVTDFGIARSIEEPRLTATGELLGTPSYMSPEQARGLETDPRTDVYSLGVMMYECLTGSLPFQADSALAVLRKIVEAEPLPPRQVRPELDGDVEYVILRAMSRDAGKRYQTAEELLADIEKYQKGIPVRRRDDLDSAEEARLRALMRELFGRVFAAFKLMALYAPDHRNVRDSTVAAWGILKEILKRKSPVSVSLAEGSLLVEGRELDASDPALRRFDDLLHRPADVGRLILRAVSTLDPAMLGSGANPHANVIVESLERIGEDLLGGKLGGWARYKKSLAEILLALNPAILQQQVLLTDAPGAEELVRKAAAEFPDDQVVGICAATYRRTRSLPSVRALVQRLLADDDRRVRLLPALKERLLAEGMSEEDFDWVVHRRMLTDLSFGDKVKKLLQCDPALMVELGAVDEVSEVVENLFATERKDEGVLILRRYLANFASGQARIRRQAVEEFVTPLRVALKAGDEPLLKEVEDALVAAATREEDPSAFGLLCEYMEAICTRHVEAGRPAATADVMVCLTSMRTSDGARSACAAEALSRLARKELVEFWSGELGRRDQEATDVLTAFGGAAVPLLLDKLAGEEESRADAFEAYARRRKLAAVLRRLGPPAVQQAVERLADPDWRRARNMVRAVEALVEDPAQARLLKPALRHRDPRVRKAAILALEHIGGSEAEAMLSVTSISELDDEVRERATLARQNTLRKKKES